MYHLASVFFFYYAVSGGLALEGGVHEYVGRTNKDEIDKKEQKTKRNNQSDLVFVLVSCKSKTRLEVLHFYHF